jgi:glycosyltransferase involved in cell wall biosynthesis
MKILLTVEFYWPRIGGAEEVCRHIAEGLATRGHEVHVATGRDHEPRSGTIAGVAIHEFGITGNEVKGLRGEVPQYRAFLRSFECDVLLNYAAQSWATDVALQELPRLAARRKVLATCGFSGLSTPLRRLAYWHYFRRMPERLRAYDLVVYHSEGFRDAVFGRAHGIRNSTVIPNGVDLDEFNVPQGATRAQIQIGDRPLIVNVSNHYRLKGHDRFIRLAAAVPDAAFLLLGNDSGRSGQSCSAACLRAAKKGLIICREGTRPAVRSALRDSDLMVFTSRSEVAPLVPLEASAAGIPWVSFEVGNMRELRGGVVVVHESELVATVRRLLQDPQERVGLAEEGRRFVSRLGWETIVARYESEFEQLLNTANWRSRLVNQG